MSLIKVGLFCSVFLFFSFSQYSQQKGGKLWGYVFGDYFFKISGDSTSQSTQYSPYSKSYQAFELRRIYLGYDYIFSDKFSSSFLLEGNDKILTNSRHGIFIKSAFLEWKTFKDVSFAIGLVPTPTWSWALNEKEWNYRSVEKTITDMRGLGIASDLGVATRGKFDNEGNYGFAFMIGNGTGQRPEFNKFKKYYGTIYAKPFKNFQTEIYADYEPVSSEKSRITLKGFASFKFRKFTLGLEAVSQNRKNEGGENINVNPFGISSFIRGNLIGKEQEILNVFIRYDFFNPDLNNDSAGYNENFFCAGLDYMPLENVHFMPNLWFNSYSSKTSSLPHRKSDLVIRMTFFYLYK
ncbi:MAG: hypothetical protein N2510_03500 [Ignavibacteria bacterium]|nr:hypothetical protein [Ignavibacteria bacterium]